MTLFDDFLGLAERQWPDGAMILFHGRSGSGKSTAIRFLLDHVYRGRRVHRIQGPPFEEVMRATGERDEIIVIDEVNSMRDLLRLRHVLRTPATRIVATHVHPHWFRAFAPTRITVLQTDREPAKIARHLGSKGVSATAAAVNEFVRRFGATYTDADLILERCPSHSFDEALARFIKFHRLDLQR